MSDIYDTLVVITIIQTKRKSTFLCSVVLWHILYGVNIVGKMLHKGEVDVEQSMHQLKSLLGFPYELS